MMHGAYNVKLKNKYFVCERRKVGSEDWDLLQAFFHNLSHILLPYTLY